MSEEKNRIYRKRKSDGELIVVCDMEELTEIVWYTIAAIAAGEGSNFARRKKAEQFLVILAKMSEDITPF